MTLPTRPRLLARLALGFALSVGAEPARGDEVLVYAASSLTDVLEEIGRTWEAVSGHKVVLNLGASSDLGRQLRAGAPGDVFLSADREQMDLVERDGIVRSRERVELLSNALVVVVPARSLPTLRVPADLAAVGKLALADPEVVPAGVYARRWLEAIGLWDQVRPKVVPTLNVRAALSAVESGNAGAAIVYRTDAAVSDRVRVAFQVSGPEAPSIVYVVAPLSASRKPAARAFVQYLRSAPARAAFARAGFLTLDGR
jgi:molybdate transport system substrate-binding protein